MKNYLLQNATLVNEGKQWQADVLIKNGRIEKVAGSISASPELEVVDLKGLYLLPGGIDDQVHFREPGFPDKGNIGSESKAAVAGGVTSFLEMPNTNPTTTNQQALDHKLGLAGKTSWANFGFFFGATNQNLEQVLSVDPSKTCGIKIFMGSSTGDMLVDNLPVLERIFAGTDLVIATHCEDETTVRNNIELAKTKYRDGIPMWEHPNIRSREACFLSTSLAIDLAKKFNSNLHVLHITTKEEVELFEKGVMKDKRITAEACVHHLWFEESDYQRLGGLIKCNPAIKKKTDQEALWLALNNDSIDIVATDHAPHTWEEKQRGYLNCPSGLPLVQHGYQMMLDGVFQNKISIEKVVEKMCHNPAERFRIVDRGYLREGYWADLTVVGMGERQMVDKENLLYYCGWSPLEGVSLHSKIHRTFVNGIQVYDGQFIENQVGKQLNYLRN